MSEIRDQVALDRVLARFGHVHRADFNERNVMHRTMMQALVSKLMHSTAPAADVAESREGFALLVRVGMKLNVPPLTLRICEQKIRVLDRRLDGIAAPGDMHVVTKEEVLAQVGEIERTEHHE